MKILELRFKNLNSLYGEWSIDFTNPEYVSNGIFAITGPTGAGKSTILDAICLALYGETPRLDRVTKSGNEIMSRQTGDCFAEVTFEAQTGTFRTMWSNHRARNKADGKLAEPKHEISDARTGEIIESKKSRVLDVVKEKTGLDFEQFTRSILLAQGNFAAFLQSDSNNRSTILEQITGTGIYSVISTRVHTRHRAEQKRLDALTIEIEGHLLLKPDDVAAVQESLTQKESATKELAAKQKHIDVALNWIKSVETLSKEHTILEGEVAKVNDERVLVLPQVNQLALAQKAAELEGDYRGLSLKREELEGDVKAVEKGRALIPETLRVLETCRVVVTKNQNIVAQSNEILKQERELTKLVRAKDSVIGEKQKAITSRVHENNDLADSLSERREIREKNATKQKDLLAEREAVECYLKEQSGDAVLVSQYERLSGALKSLTELSNTVIARKEQLLNQQAQEQLVSTQIFTQEEQRIKKEHEIEVFNLHLEELLEAEESILAGKSIAEHKLEREGLIEEQTQRRLIAGFTEHRANLRDGDACPLCGAEEHPYTSGTTPVVDDITKQLNSVTALMGAVENIHLQLNPLKDREKRVKDEYAELDKNMSILKVKREESAIRCGQYEIEYQAAVKRFDKEHLRAQEELAQFDIKIASDQSLESIDTKLKSRLDKWNQKQEIKSMLDKQENECAQELKQLEGAISTLSKTLEEQNAKGAALKDELQLLTNERTELYGTKDPDGEEQRLSRLLENAEQELQTSIDILAAENEKYQNYQTRIKTLEESIALLTPQLEAIEGSFTEKRSSYGFESEDHFRDARMDVEKRTKIEILDRTLKERIVEVSTRLKDVSIKLESEQAKNITEQPLNELMLEQDGVSEQLKQMNEEVGMLKEKLASNSRTQKLVKEKQKSIDAQKLECLRWNKLKDLIGSNDGKRFRNYAQGLTFDMLINHANIQLQKMSDRYLLTRCETDEKNLLDLNIVDNYQAGEERSTKNLSGGESFIISMALALGLSKMASKKVRVDSLFLDEGFGTLDEEALETALDTLSGLHQEGKLIGVISHVSALKARISAQIGVKKRSGGRSVLEGPGCLFIATKV